MKNRKIFFLEYPRTTIYIGLCLLVFAAVVALVYAAWPIYFMGGELLSGEVLNPPIPDRIEAERQLFLTRYCFLCAGSAMAAFLFYIVFNLVCLHDFDGFSSHRKTWRAGHIASYAVLLLAVWNRFFTLPAALQIGFDIGLLAFIVLMMSFWCVTGVFRRMRAGRKSGGRQGHAVASPKNTLTVLDVAVSLLAALIVMDQYLFFGPILRAILALPNDRVFFPNAVTTYRLDISPQYLMAAVPLLPMLMLVMWCCLCMPRLLGRSLSAPNRTSFICLDKRQ